MKRFTTFAAVAAGFALLTTGCASKKYVRGTIAPVEERVGEVETQSAENQERLGGLEGRVDREVSRLDEKAQTALNDAAEAQASASRAQAAANDAAGMAAEAKTFAGAGLDRLEQTMIDLTRYQPVDTQSIQFGFDNSTLTRDSVAKLDALLATIGARSNYVVEVRGFTDSTGSASYNVQLSQRRAEAVVRYLNANGVPLRHIHRIGLGSINPTAENTTRQGRQQNRRVEVSLYVPVADASTELTRR